MNYILKIVLKDDERCNGCPCLKNTISAHMCAVMPDKKEFSQRHRFDGGVADRPHWCPLDGVEK